MTQSYLNDLFRQYDVDRDGSVDFEEFQQYVRQRESALQRAFRWGWPCRHAGPYLWLTEALHR